MKLWERLICPSANLKLLQNCTKSAGFVQFQPFHIDLGHSALQDGGASPEVQRLGGLVSRTLPLVKCFLWILISFSTRLFRCTRSTWKHAS